MKKTLILFLLSTAYAFGAYKYVRPITIPANQVHVSPSDAGSLTNYVVHIVGTFPYLATIANGGSLTSSSGFDAAFFSDSTCATPLNFLRPNWNGTTGASEWKVQKTLSSTVNNTFYLCYGNSSITTDQQSTATYDAAYKGVWGLGNTNGTGVLDLHDQTANAQTGTTTVVTSVPGQNDGAGFFNGNGGVHVGTTAPLQSPTGAITVSAWVAPSVLNQNGGANCCSVILAQQWASPTNSFPFWSYYLSANDSSCSTPNSFSFFWATGSVTGSLQHVCSDSIGSGSQYTPGLWYLVTATYDGTTATIYVNGFKTATNAVTGTIAYGGTGSFNIGSIANDNQGFTGAIDEVIVANVARSAGWIQTVYNNELKPWEFYSIGAPLTNSSLITNVSVIPTNTQVVLKFTAPAGTSASSCFVTVSPDPSMYPNVPDTDPTLFTGANLASRTGNQINGRTVTAVLGRRFQAYYATAAGADTSIRWSRALQTNQPHAADINCSGEEYQASFNTATLQLGQAHEDSIPGDPNVSGGAMWPSWLADTRCNVADTGCTVRGDQQRRSFWTTDPQTGVYIKPLNMMGDNVQDLGTANFMLTSAGAGWTAPSNWVNGGGINASITNSTSKIFAVGMQPGGANTAFNTVNTPDYAVAAMLKFNITASITGGATTCDGTNTGDDCKIQACVSLDGVSCAPNAKTYDILISSTTAKQYTIGSGEVMDVLQQPGKRLWTVNETSTRGGTVTCSGTQVTVTWNGAFSELMAGVTINPGSLAQINGNTYTVASVQASTRFNTTVAPSPCTSLSYNGFSVAVWKKTVGATGDTLNVSNPSLRVLGSSDVDPQVNAGYISSTSSITLGNGHGAGILSTNMGEYLIDWVNGDVYPYNSPNAGVVSPTNVAVAGPQNGIDGQGRYWYLNTSDRSIHYIQYVGDYQRPYIRGNNGNQISIPLWQVFAFTGLQSCSALPAGASRCYNDVQVTNATTGGIWKLLNAFDSRYPANGGHFQQFAISGVEPNDVLNLSLIYNGQGIQDYWAWHVLFDPHACDNADVVKDVSGSCSTGNPFGPGCVGTSSNPVPGCVVGARENWATAGARWTIDKGAIVALKAGWVTDQSSGTTVANIASGIVGTTFSSTTCPSGVPNLIGTNTPTTSCISLTTDDLPYWVPDGTVSRAYFNTPIAVGDYAAIDNVGSPSYQSGLGSFPLLDVATITAGTGTQWNLVLACINNNICPTALPANKLYMLTNYPTSYPPWSTYCCSGGMTNTIWWNWPNNQHGNSPIFPDLNQLNGHSAAINGVMTGFDSGGDPTGSSPHYNNRDYRALSDAQFGTNVSNTVGATGAPILTTGSSLDASIFAGQQGNQGMQIQSHPNVGNSGVVLANPITIVDGNGIGGAASPYPPSAQVTLVTGSLYVLSSTWVTSTLQLHQKILDTQATSASRIMRNISGPGSVIASDSTGYYTYCYVLLANECQSGSTPGQIYFNVPYFMGKMTVANTNGGACLGGSFEGATPTSNMWEMNDICFFDAGTFQQDNQAQITGYDLTGWSRRGLGHNFAQGRAGIFKAVQGANLQADSPFPGWLYTQFEYNDGRFATVLMKNPAVIPSANDSARNNFASVQVNIHVPSGADHAGVEIAYDDYNGFCSPNRAETCIAVGAAVNSTTPWYWEASESGSYTPLSCASTCTVAVPLLWEHVARVTPVYFSGSTIVGRGQTQIVPVL